MLNAYMQLSKYTAALSFYAMTISSIMMRKTDQHGQSDSVTYKEDELTLGDMMVVVCLQSPFPFCSLTSAIRIDIRAFPVSRPSFVFPRDKHYDSVCIFRVQYQRCLIFLILSFQHR